jgi:hypothetical protein
MAHTHEFDCIICGAHLDSRKELDQHNQREHTRQASSESPKQSANDEGKPSQQGNEVS